MHISEGVLTWPILVGGAAVSIAGVAIGLKKTDYDKLPQVAVLASTFFIASFIHVPVGPSAAHLVLNGLCGIILGWGAFPAIFVGLALQALLFQYGGLTTLGINTFIMAVPAIVVYLAFSSLAGKQGGVIPRVAEFAAGAVAIFLSGLFAALSLALSGEAFVPAAKLLILVHIPLMIIEGIITVFTIEFIKKVKPDILTGRR